MKTFNLLFGTLEPPFLWEFLADEYERVLWPSDIRQSHTCNSMSEFCNLVAMLLSVIPLVRLVRAPVRFIETDCDKISLSSFP